MANEVTEFNLGFKWGNPITLVQNGDNEDSNLTEAIAELNSCYESQNARQKQQELARYVEIGGVGYVLIDVNTEYEDGESYFTYDVLDPRTTFVVRSTAYSDKRVILAVLISKTNIAVQDITPVLQKIFAMKLPTQKSLTDQKKGKTKWGFLERSGEENPLHKIPIIEYTRSFDRMGCF